MQKRLSQVIIIEKLHSKQTNIVNLNVSKIESENFKTIITNNGIEFAKLSKPEMPFNFLTYCAHPYHSCDRGSIKNVNSIIRRFLPKETNLKCILEYKSLEIENWINNFPRKILNWKSAKQIFNKFMIIHIFCYANSLI